MKDPGKTFAIAHKKRWENKHKNVHKTPENMNEIGSKNLKNVWKTNMKTYIKHKKTRKKRI